MVQMGFVVASNFSAIAVAGLLQLVRVDPVNQPLFFTSDPGRW